MAKKEEENRKWAHSVPRNQGQWDPAWMHFFLDFYLILALLVLYMQWQWKGKAIFDKQSFLITERILNKLRKLKSCRSRTRTWSKKKSAFLEKLRGSFQNLDSFRCLHLYCQGYCCFLTAPIQMCYLRK